MGYRKDVHNVFTILLFSIFGLGIGLCIKAFMDYNEITDVSSGSVLGFVVVFFFFIAVIGTVQKRR